MLLGQVPAERRAGLALGSGTQWVQEPGAGCWHVGKALLVAPRSGRGFQLILGYKPGVISWYLTALTWVNARG